MHSTKFHGKRQHLLKMSEILQLNLTGQVKFLRFSSPPLIDRTNMICSGQPMDDAEFAALIEV